MRFGLIIAYFALLILVLVGIGAISAEEAYEIDGRTYHQRIFGFTLELPADWMVVDEGAISPHGDYLIALGPDVPSRATLNINFLPVNGLTLIEFINENLLDSVTETKIDLSESRIGNVDCYISRQCMNVRQSSDFPDLTNVFARLGDHFMRAMVYSYDESEREQVLDVLDSIHFDESLREVSFLAVENHSRYGIPIITEQNSQMYLFSEDPEIRANVSSADGSEFVIFDDLTYPARFPEGEHRDLNGFRIQFYSDGRYQVDNRGKRIDVYIPDISVDAADFRMGVDMRFEGGHPLKGNGIVFRGGKSGFYLFEISQDSHFALYRFSGGFETVIEKTFAPEIQPFENNRIEVQAKGDEMLFFINGKSVRTISIEDDIDSGFVGFYVCAGSWSSFDDYYLEIYK